MTSRERFELGLPVVFQGIPTKESWVKQVFIGGRQMGKSYFETTWLPDAELFKAQAVAMEQNELVMAIFRRKRRALTPWEVWQEGAQKGRQWLITSVRRSMSVLSAGESPALVKLDSLRMGPHGKPSHEWCLPEDRPEAKA